jgi:hypothetical protein
VGRNYSFEVIFDVSDVDDVLSGLGDVLIEDDRQRIQRSLPWEPEQVVRRWIPAENRLFEIRCGIKNAREPDHDPSEGHYCFTLRLPLTGNLRRLSKRYYPYALSQDSRQAYIDLGHVWTEIRIGREWGLLTLTAVGTGMSCLFQESVEIQQALIDALEPCTKVILLYDYEGWEDEAEEVTTLHPWRGKVPPWDRDQARVVHEYSFEGQAQYSRHLGLDPDRYATLVCGELGNGLSLNRR